MRILIITQYFWPENFKINDIALGLQERGHYIEILTGKPNYPKGKYFKGYNYTNKRTEIWKGILINRSFLLPRGNGRSLSLILNYLSFAFFASIKVFFLKNKFDKIFVFERSPITVGIPAIFAKMKFKIPIYFWVQDLWPESITAAGNVNNKLILNLLNKLTKLIYNNSDKILVQSKAFIPFIKSQKINENKIIYFPNTTEEFYKYKEPNINILSTLPNGFKIMFAGNIGESQDFDTLLNSAFILKNQNINVNWIILGEGRLKNYVYEKILTLGLEENFILLGSFQSELIPDFFSCADFLLVSLKNQKIFSLTIPSKVQSYLASSKPIIGCLNGEGARIIQEANAGLISSAENPQELSDVIKRATLLSKEELRKMGENGRKYFDKEFSRNTLLNKLEVIFEN